MNDLTKLLAVCGTALTIAITGCNEKNTGSSGSNAKPAASSSHDHDDHDDHDGHDHDEHDGHDHSDHDDHDGHDHGGHSHGDEVALGSTIVGEYEVECWQAHGELAAGKELYITVKLPFDDQGKSVVRVWIGTEDRLASVVGRADYSASGKKYEAHAEAPSPLPAGAAWWIEIEQPDGSLHIGTIKPH